jgi:hypothetical protein
VEEGRVEETTCAFGVEVGWVWRKREVPMEVVVMSSKRKGGKQGGELTSFGSEGQSEAKGGRGNEHAHR